MWHLRGILQPLASSCRLEVVLKATTNKRRFGFWRCIEEQRVSQRRRESRRVSERFTLSKPTPVRFFLAEEEWEGLLTDISKDSMRVVTTCKPSVGGKIRLYIDQLGWIEGLVARITEDGFAVDASFGDHKPLRLLEWFDTIAADLGIDISLSDRRVGDRRSSRRDVLEFDVVTGTRSNGAPFVCELSKLSLHGVEILTDAHLDIGEQILLNDTVGIVNKKIDAGYQIHHPCK